MKMKASISCFYEDESTSQAIASALQPDNLQAPEGVDVKTFRKEGQVVTKVKVDGRIETLLATLDDLLSCTSTAEEMI
ncbi:hypothetical protein AKJ43_01430 [candidate division MSBL1 archaeon SCGC-AAA261D19]|uniref:KEOPS complex subunit n=1 Tax=candidate division MSBL1 archaeon SCGC-AAA261D19 TaxID=1698273 RepID=A0A133V815_9EURY|nr:hypothetical protein AKJ43_01430 [candidate division MSBL1 archaeon SCGC-AAA261D19]